MKSPFSMLKLPLGPRNLSVGDRSMVFFLDYTT
jgi:hypothetical protein